MAKAYVPPVQSRIGQLIDSVFLLVLVYLALLAPLLLNHDDTKTAATQQTHQTVTWQQLGQNPTMQAQWEKLGYDAAKAKEIIAQRFDYEIEPVSLGITILVIVGYFVFMLRVSDRQYRQVIAERFDDR